MDEKDILEAIDLQKAILNIAIKDDELRELGAKNTKLLFDSFLKVGFSQDQSIQLVAASMRSIK